MVVLPEKDVRRARLLWSQFSAQIDCTKSLASTPLKESKAYLNALQQLTHSPGGFNDFSLTALTAHKQLHCACPCSLGLLQSRMKEGV